MKPTLIRVCNLAVPAAANHNLFVSCNVGIKMPDSRAGTCDADNKLQSICCDAAALLYFVCVRINAGSDWMLIETDPKTLTWINYWNHHADDYLSIIIHLNARSARRSNSCHKFPFILRGNKKKISIAFPCLLATIPQINVLKLHLMSRSLLSSFAHALKQSSCEGTADKPFLQNQLFLIYCSTALSSLSAHQRCRMCLRYCELPAWINCASPQSVVTDRGRREACHLKHEIPLTKSSVTQHPVGKRSTQSCKLTG